MPIERDPHRGNELFLRLPAPYSTIVLTPPRPSDVEDTLPLLNDLNVVRWLQGPPYPYTLRDSAQWYELSSKRCAAAASSYDNFVCGRCGKGIEQCPLIAIREESIPTRNQTLLGSLEFRRSEFEDVADVTEREAAKRVNDRLEAGDERLVWSIGNYIATSHHRRGIMTAAVRALINEVAVPLLNARQITVSYVSGNIGSKKVFEKNDFVYMGTVKDVYTQAESKGGETVSLGIMRWTRTSPQAQQQLKQT